MTLSIPALFGFLVAGLLLLVLTWRAIRGPGEKGESRRLEPPES
jgi:hypothetical protein